MCVCSSFAADSSISIIGSMGRCDLATSSAASRHIGRDAPRDLNRVLPRMRRTCTDLLGDADGALKTLFLRFRPVQGRRSVARLHLFKATLSFWLTLFAACWRTATLFGSSWTSSDPHRDRGTDKEVDVSWKGSVSSAGSLPGACCRMGRCLPFASKHASTAERVGLLFFFQASKQASKLGGVGDDQASSTLIQASMRASK